MSLCCFLYNCYALRKCQTTAMAPYIVHIPHVFSPLHTTDMVAYVQRSLRLQLV